MAIPTTRAEFKEYVLRRIGKGYGRINVTDEQVEDRIDEALLYYADYHYDGTEKFYYAYQLTAQDITNKYIEMPENIIGAIRIFDIYSSSSMSSEQLFDINYQITMNTIFQIGAVELAPYYIARQNLELIHQILNGSQPIRYNRHMNRLYIDSKWGSALVADKWIMVEAYRVIDPEVYPDVWGDRWLARYTAALIKRQWAENTSKFSGMQLTSGIQYNSAQKMQEAQFEIDALEREMMDSYSLPSAFLIG
jgi:hypothetical protein